MTPISLFCVIDRSYQQRLQHDISFNGQPDHLHEQMITARMFLYGIPEITRDENSRDTREWYCENYYFGTSLSGEYYIKANVLQNPLGPKDPVSVLYPDGYSPNIGPSAFFFDRGGNDPFLELPNLASYLQHGTRQTGRLLKTDWSLVTHQIVYWTPGIFEYSNLS